jgi:hypothetical protein
MGGAMIKNLIIVLLLVVLYNGISWDEFLAYGYLGLDKLQEIVYTIQSEVKK